MGYLRAWYIQSRLQLHHTILLYDSWPGNIKLLCDLFVLARPVQLQTQISGN